MRQPIPSAPPEYDDDGNRFYAEEGSAEGCASGECLPDGTPLPAAAPAAALVGPPGSSTTSGPPPGAPLAAGSPSAAAAIPAHADAPELAEPEPEPELAPVQVRSGADDLTRSIQERWRAAVDKVRGSSSRHGASLAFGRLLWLRAGEVAVAYPPEAAFHRSTVSAASGKTIVEKLLAEHFGRPTRLIIEDGAAAVAQAAKTSLAEEDASSRAAHEKSTDQMVRTHPAVRATLKLLGGQIEHIQVVEQERPQPASSSESVDDGS